MRRKHSCFSDKFHLFLNTQISPQLTVSEIGERERNGDRNIVGEKAGLDAVSGKKGANSGEHGEQSAARLPNNVQLGCPTTCMFALLLRHSLLSFVFNIYFAR